MLQYPDLIDCSDGQSLGLKSLAIQYQYIRGKDSYWGRGTSKVVFILIIYYSLYCQQHVMLCPSMILIVS